MNLNAGKILLLMAERGFNHKQLAARAGISRQTLSAVMNGRRCRPDLVGRVAKALDVKPDEIVETHN